MTKFVLAMSAVMALTACDKSGSSGSGGSGGSVDLLASVPASSNIVFGGDFLKVEKMMGELAGKMVEGNKGMKAYVDCFTSTARDLKVAGGVKISNPPTMTLVMTGIGVSEIEKCATEAGFKVAKDADGKFITIETAMNGLGKQQSYLQLASGALYSEQSISRHAAPVARKDLEVNAANAASTNALADKSLKGLIDKADKSKMLWFAGNGAGTSIGTKVGEIYGGLDVNPDIALSIDVQITDPMMLTMVDGYMAKAKDLAGNFGDDIKAIIETLDYKKDNDRVHFGVKVTQDQLKGMMKQFGGMFRMGGGGGM